MFSCSFITSEHQPSDPPDVQGPERKTAKAAIRIATIQAIKEGYAGDRVRLLLEEDGCLLLTAHGDTPEAAENEARSLLDRNRRRF